VGDQRPKRDSMSLEEATVSNMWKIAAIVEVLERKGPCTKQDLYVTSSRSFVAAPLDLKNRAVGWVIGGGSLSFQLYSAQVSAFRS
jgi:hypothetical protein